MKRLWPTRRGAALVLLAGALAGCGTAMKTQGFDSPDPGAKLRAIVDAGRAGDAKALPNLVDQLDSDDPAVRMCSIIALDRITGTRLGYSPYAPAPEREASIGEWVKAIEDGRFSKSTGRVSR